MNQIDSTINTSRSDEQPLNRPVIVINNSVSQAPTGQPVVANVDRTEMDKWAGRLKITSWIKIVIGVWSAFSMVFCWFKSRHISQAIYATKGEHKDWHHEAIPKLDPMGVLSQDEFDLYDVFKGFSFYGILLGMSLACAGCKSLKVIKANSPTFTHKVFRCVACKVVMVVFFSLLMHGKGREMKTIIARFKHTDAPRNLAEVPETTSITQFEDSEDMDEDEMTQPEDVARPAAKMMPDLGFGKNKRTHSMKCPFPAILFFNVLAHFYFLKKFEKAQRDFTANGGELIENKEVQSCH